MLLFVKLKIPKMKYQKNHSAMKINPYRIALNSLWMRIRWDLHPYAWTSRRRILSWKNRFPKGKAVILCNGPSLNRVNFENLKEHKIFTFGLNKINLIFTKTDFRPSVIVAVNPYVVEQNTNFFANTDIPLFLDSRVKKNVDFGSNVHFLHIARGPAQFARDCSISIVEGATVTYIAMQLAFHMGFRMVALVGCDHSYETKGAANAVVESGHQDPDHFDPQYFSGGLKWQLPDLIGSELNYKVAGETFERYGGKIVNCTDGGKLELFERQSLDSFLENNTTV